MAALVPIGEFLAYAGIGSDDQVVAQSVLDGVENLLIAGLGRSHAPFAAADPARAQFKVTVGPGGLTDMTPARDDDWGFGGTLKPVS